jgi:hypothetical protein
MNPGERFPRGAEPPPDPYAPPTARRWKPDAPLDLNDLPAQLRLAYLDREMAIRRVSWINFGLAIIWIPAAIGTVLMSALLFLRAVGINPVRYHFPGKMPTVPIFLGLTVFHAASWP